VSPLIGQLQGLPRMVLFAGMHELPLADARALVRHMEAEGRDMDLFEYPGMFHMWMAVTWMPEAKEAFGRNAGPVEER